MSHHEEPVVQEESLITKILKKEQGLKDAIARAKVDAAEIVENAGIKAERMISEAKQEVLAAEEARRAEEEEANDSEEVKKRKQEVAEKEKAVVAQIHAKIAKNSSAAVTAIIDEVLPVL